MYHQQYPLQLDYCFALAFSVLIVNWLTADKTPPATATYPPTVTTIAGKVTGAARIVPPTAAKTNPIFQSTLKNFGVGDFTLLIIFIINEFKI